MKQTNNLQPTKLSGKVNKMSEVEELLKKIIKLYKVDDLRDLFDMLNTWGYETDFTYMGEVIYPREGATIESYLKAFLEDES